MFPRRLVFCGGGTRVITFVHALVELERAGRLRNVNEYWGTSAGALIASLFALSKTAMRMRTVLDMVDFVKFRDMDVTNLFTITSSWGLDDGTSLLKELERIFELIEPGSCFRTLRDVPELNIVVSDLNIRETVVCNAINYPTLRVVEAVRASMSLPIFFKPYVNPINGHYWVDGAVRANFPWDQLPNDEARRESLGFAFLKTTDVAPISFMDYVFSMIHFDEPKKFKHLKQYWNSNILFFPVPPFPAWFMRLLPEDHKLLETNGVQTAHEWLTQHPSSVVKTPEIPPRCAHRCIRSYSLPHRKIGLSDIRSPFPLPVRDSFPPLSPSIGLSFRRWSV